MYICPFDCRNAQPDDALQPQAYLCEAHNLVRLLLPALAVLAEASNLFEQGRLYRHPQLHTQSLPPLVTLFPSITKSRSRLAPAEIEIQG
jgi:hypothetical protein